MDFKPFENNPRTRGPEAIDKLRTNLRELGDVSGFTLNIRNNQFVTANQRSEAMSFDWENVEIVEKYDEPDAQGTVGLGWYHWDGGRYFVRLVDWDDETAKKANIIGNVHAATWDGKLLREHWNTDDLKEWGLNGRDLSVPANPERSTAEDAYAGPDPAGKIHTQPGDLYELDGHRLLCGSSVDPEHVEKLVNGAVINEVVTDPPYNVNYKGKRKAREQIKNDKLKEEDFAEFVRLFFQNYAPYCAPGAVWYVFHADARGHVFRQQMTDAGIYLAQGLVWVKHHHVIGYADYLWKHEPVLYGWVKDEQQADQIKELVERELGLKLSKFDVNHTPILYGWTKPGSHLWRNDRRQTTVIEYDKPQVNPEHPTEKPVGLVEYFVQNNSEPGNIICDPFAGSGPVLIACENTRRTAYLMELQPSFCDAIVRGWVKLKNKKGEAFTLKKNGKTIANQKWLIE